MSSKRKDSRDRSRKESKRSKKSRDDDDRPTRRARAYADVNERFSESRFDIKGFPIKYGDFKKYKIGDKIGEGAYSEVFEAINNKTQEKCVVKTIRPEKEEKIKLQRELKILTLLQSGKNIIKLLDVVKDPKTRLKLLVFEHVENPDFRLTFYNFDDQEARHYMYQLLLSLDYTHSQGIIHRDVKPRNVLYDPASKRLRLIDWGFGEFYFPGKAIEKWPGTRYYKAPELFFRYPYYDYSVDMWSYGCILGSLLFARMPMFKGREDSLSQLVEITKCLGTDDLHAYLHKYRIAIRHKYRKGIKKRKRKDWSAYINSKHEAMCSAEGMDLLDKILVWDHEKRWSTKECLAHPFFDSVRHMASASSTKTRSTSYSEETETTTATASSANVYSSSEPTRASSDAEASAKSCSGGGSGATKGSAAKGSSAAAKAKRSKKSPDSKGKAAARESASSGAGSS